MKLNTGTLYIYIYIIYTLYIHIYSILGFLGAGPSVIFVSKTLFEGIIPLSANNPFGGSGSVPRSDQIWPPLTSAMDHLVQWFTHDFQSKFPFPYCKSAKYSISVIYDPLHKIFKKKNIIPCSPLNIIKPKNLGFRPPCSPPFHPVPPRVVKKHPETPEVHLLAVAFAEQDLLAAPTERDVWWGPAVWSWLVHKPPYI